jgi:glucose/arabinose dehydrogenase
MRTLVLASAIVLAASRVSAAVPNGFVDEVVVGGIAAGTAMAFAPDGRLFVCQQGGVVRVVKNGALLVEPFVTLPVNTAGERGLIGIAFDPAFAANGYVYLHYTTAAAPIRNRVSRFTASGDVAVPGSEVVLIELNPLSGATNHNGGALAFLADGTLLVAVGENATPSNAQTLENLLGKMLRINTDGSIPTDNPFYGTAAGVNRAIWALGLRNPFTFAVQESTNRVFLNDVGQSTWEEINEGLAGANYGWPLSEGYTSTLGQTSPVYAYGHGAGAFLGCAIAGGAFYEALTTPFPSAYDGDYFFADLCGGWINRRDAATGIVATFASGASGPVDLDVGSDGALYYLARTAGTVRRIRYVPAAVQALTRTTPGTPMAGLPISWTASATGGGTLEYQFWVYDPGLQSWTSTAYSSSNTFSFTPPAAGNYIVQAWARNAGSSETWEGYASSGAFIVAPTVPAVPTLVASPALPVVAGTQVTWTAATAGGRQPTQYRFWLFEQSTGLWQVARDWSAQPSWSWRPSRADTYVVQVWVRSAGSLAAYETWRSSGLVTVAPGPVAAYRLESDPPRPFAPGTSVRWTIVASGGVEPLEYQFWGYDGASWSMIRNYAPDRTATWVVGAGTRAVQGWVRAVGSSAAYQAWTGTGLFQVAPAAVSVTLQSNQTFPLPVNTPITWKATATGGSAPLEYRFWRYNGSTWTSVQGWSSASSWSWTPGVGDAGTYALQVWVRSAGQPSYEAWAPSGVFTLSP